MKESKQMDDCRAIKAEAVDGHWYAIYAGDYLYEKRGNIRVFYSEKAALRAAKKEKNKVRA
ncbi:MAG TPA: hypothetical protein VHA37_01800 [Candidatus Saccharimonadales bacterium]|nr:hypothetical protein [Candidatus Saccharimonadales bacterium]